MKTLRAHRGTLSLMTAVLCPLALALVLIPFRGSFTTSASALLFVAVIVAVAAIGNRFCGALATVSSALWFDFFLTVPYQRLAISHRPDIETTVCLLVVGIIVTELAARNRHHHHAAVEESDYVALINEMAQLASSTAPVDMVTLRASSTIAKLLDLRTCRFEVGTPDPQMARLQANGTIVHAGIVWPTDQAGMPGPESQIPVEWRGVAVGRFVMTPMPGLPVGMRPRVVAATIADVVAAAVSGQVRIP